MQRNALLILTALAASASAGLADAVKPIPWLAGVTTDGVYVCLEATDTTGAVVDYGLTDSYGSQAGTESTQATDYGYSVHNVKLSDLAPDTLYHYRVTHGSSVSADYTFYTAPEAGTSARWGFAADCRSNPGVHNTMAGLIQSHDPRMMVYGGDLCERPPWSYWNNEWFMPNQNALNATAPFVNAAGNHEDWGPLTKAYTQSPAGDGVGGGGYFSFDYGDTHILVLNTEVSYGAGSAQWNFAAADLAASTAAWKAVAFHKSAYAAGGHGEDGGMVAMTQQVFEPNGVDLVLTGHSHFYQHNLVNDIHHMVLGTFGVDTRTPGSASYTIRSEETRNFGIVETTPEELTLTTYRSDGTVIEVITIEDGGGPPPPPTNTVTFQQGVGGYTGTVDTFLQQYPPYADRDNSAALELGVDNNDPHKSNYDSQALLRFDGIFGSGPDQIPATLSPWDIQSAALELYTTNEGDGADLHRMMVSWNDTDTWNSMANGIQANDIEAASSPDVATVSMSEGTGTVDVTGSIKMWLAAADPDAANEGWAFLPVGGDGWDFYSADSTWPPKLTVVRFPERGELPGDANFDCIVDLSDVVVAIDHWQGTGDDARWVTGDVNLDGIVNVRDIVEMIDHWQEECSAVPAGAAEDTTVPEPAALSWFCGAAALFLLKRRRRN